MSETKQEDRWNVRPIVEVALNNTFMDGDWILTEDLSQSPNGVRLIQLSNIGKGTSLEIQGGCFWEKPFGGLAGTVEREEEFWFPRWPVQFHGPSSLPHFPIP